MTFRPGDEVVVEFDGIEHAGVIEKKVGKGFWHCRIEVDVVTDYTTEPPPQALSPQITVAVRENHIRKT